METGRGERKRVRERRPISQHTRPKDPGRTLGREAQAGFDARQRSASARSVSSVAVKAITILVLGGVVLGVWTQRQSLIDCGEEVQQKYRSGDFSATQCSFFGAEVDITLPGG